MRDDQRLARIFGVLYLITFVTSIAALALYQPILDDPAAYARYRARVPALFPWPRGATAS